MSHKIFIEGFPLESRHSLINLKCLMLPDGKASSQSALAKCSSLELVRMLWKHVSFALCIPLDSIHDSLCRHKYDVKQKVKEMNINQNLPLYPKYCTAYTLQCRAQFGKTSIWNEVNPDELTILQMDYFHYCAHPILFRRAHDAIGTRAQLLPRTNTRKQLSVDLSDKKNNLKH